ncbi:ABC transporter ATP-binding protein [Hymenobacter sp. BT770]|uniref:ABC transporter ATP-binding protein n=1 Tax=Hymenobacter sp. BT770 TaxID=2886942 RepID=UPI001D1301CD|nr:ABC transporter ATP-binding protein [Hymenobacter sp. BT770]MCC3153815.1 ABC transporter ATP-binding protein [Hymenobacter sp. BT770]MDO3415959.1 ABC transporter ATP-binding protein [Hymenobacter sp. BT770]
MNNIAIRVEDLGKQYRLGEIGTGTLSHDLNRWWSRIRGKEDPFAKIGEANDRTKKGNSEYVWALKDVNFEVKKGEVLGIIGRNGAGKSTLLKILSKVTAPTTGRIKVQGRIASLLEVGTGFHPDLTGRENVYLNGAILGMTKGEINRKFDEIVDFSGVERYIDTPVKRYSSGMYVRLAFAVSAFLEPEILIVDEVLAVGDAEFQKKCLGRMKDVSRNEGRTILFVSHSMAAVKNICTTGILMKNGELAFAGTADDIVDYYIANFSEFNPMSKVYIEAKHRPYYANRSIKYESIEFINPSENNYFSTKGAIAILLKLSSIINCDAFRVAFSVNKIDESPVGTFFSEEIFSIRNGETKDIMLSLKDHQLAKGQYYLSFSVGVGNEITGITDYDTVIQTLFFEIAYNDVANERMITLWNSEWGSMNFQNVELR